MIAYKTESVWPDLKVSSYSNTNIGVAEEESLQMY